MATITREKFLEDVRTEVERLKANATPEEIAKLDIIDFDPDNKSSCIYGQMTGSCESERAKELMDKACVRVTKESRILKGLHPFNAVSDIINGKYKSQTWGEKWGEKRYTRNYNHLSMVETYILLKGASPQNIMAYLRDEVETLELPLD